MAPQNQTTMESSLFLLISLFVSTVFCAGCGSLDGYLKPNAHGRTMLDTALETVMLERRDLTLHHVTTHEVPLMLSTVRGLLQTPAAAVSFVDDIDRRIHRSLSDIVALAAILLDADIDSMKTNAFCDPNPAVPEELRALVWSLSAADALLGKAFEDVTRDELAAVRDEIMHYLMAGDTREGRTRREHQRALEKVCQYAERIHRRSIAQAAYVVARAIASFIETSSRGTGATPAPQSIATPLGRIVIGSEGDDRYTGLMPLVLYDPGGNDTYCFTEQAPLCVIIDRAGNDSYIGTDHAVPGAGLTGVGAIVDLQGNDRYASSRYGQGFGFLGVGIVVDGEGDDTYEIGMLGQGAAVLGMGILYDGSGNDVYRCDLYGQGMGMSGGIGMLIDRSGDDTYTAGMTVVDAREQAGAFQTYAQGFGLGMRDFAAGGIGILADGSGNDRYQGSYFCQGAGYWLGMGMLIDTSGADVYHARRYAQGAGVHDAVGVLADTGGDDRYTSWGVSQGCGHDYGMGMLYDRFGNDRYEATWLSQGAGSSAGFGFLFDEHGDDTYSGKGNTLRGCGAYDDRRDMVSLGVFIDRTGFDSFPEPLSQPYLRRCGDIGVACIGCEGMGLLWHEKLTRSPPVYHRRDMTPDGDNQTLTLPELEAPLFLENSWNRAAELLAARGPAVLPLLCRYADIKNVSVQRTIEETVKRLCHSSPDAVYTFVRNELEDIRALTVFLYAIGDREDNASQQLFLHFLAHNHPAVQAMALRGLYKLRAPVPAAYRDTVQRSSSSTVRRFFCHALGAAPDADGFAALCRLLEDGDMQVRYAAYRALREHACRALPFLRKCKARIKRRGPAATMVEELIQIATSGNTQ
ncbi:MAG: HEAT repeat domain-containing protein [Desulfobacterota bacterium]|nr:HEAT repeat domain-containing protein [Thermodesulfobacteriota bacterium]